MKRYRGQELQDRLDRTMQLLSLVPPGLCMICLGRDQVSEAEVIIADLLTEKETGKLTINGHFKMRLCASHWSHLRRSHEDGGVPMRLA